MTLRLVHRRLKRHRARCAWPPDIYRPPSRMAFLVADAKAFGRSLVEHLAVLNEAPDDGCDIPF